MIDERARFGKIELKVQSEVVKKVYESLRSEILTAPKRLELRKVLPCAFGTKGVCCRNCSMGPCQIIEGLEELKGICGVSASTVVARNFARMVASGTTAYIEHAKSLTKFFSHLVNSRNLSKIEDSKLKILAGILEINSELPTEELLKLIAEKLPKIYFHQEKVENFLKRAPKPILKRWEIHRIIPQGIDREIVEIFHRTHTGVDQEYKNIFLGAAKCSLVNGWIASFIGTILREIIFNPLELTKKKIKIGLGVLAEDKVNIAIFTHNPFLIEALIKAISEPEIQEKCKKVKAKGINLVGVGGVETETLIKTQISVVGSFIYQEALVGTGALEAVIIDTHCIMPNTIEMTKYFHTALITVNPVVKIEGSTYIEFNENEPLETAKQILNIAIERFRLRQFFDIPPSISQMIVGFNEEDVIKILKGDSENHLWKNIVDGKILGVVCIIGCDNYRVDKPIHVELVRELIANNILVITTGCVGIDIGMAGLINEEAISFAGEGLREILEKLEYPPVIYLGSCMDNSKILQIITELVGNDKEGNSFKFPLVICAPQWMNEKIVSTGMCFASSGLQVIFGPKLPVTGSKIATDFLFYEMENYFGGSFRIAENTEEFVTFIMDSINSKRKILNI